MNSYLLKSFTGISEFEDKGIKGAFKFGKSIETRKKIDSLSCQQALAEESAGVIVDLIHFIVQSSDGNAYGFGNTGKIYKRTSAGVWTVVYTDTNGAILGATEWLLNTGKKYLFWATATRLNCKEIPGDTGWTDVNALATYPKTTLTTATWHVMAQTVGSLQICNSEYLAMVGYDGSWTNASLTLYSGSIGQTIHERKNYAVIGARRTISSKESALILWDTSSLSHNDKQILPDGELNAMLDTEIPLLQIGSDGAVYYADFSTYVPLFSFPGGGKVNPAGVTKDGGLALFGVWSATTGYNGIYSYGRKKLNQERTLNFDYPITCDEIGAVAKIGSDILVTYKYGTSYKAMKVGATKATAEYYSLDSPASITQAKFPALPRWAYVVLTMKALPVSTKVEVFYRLEKAGSWIQAKMEGEVAELTTTGATEGVFLIGEDAKTIEIEIKCTPYNNTTPEIYRAEVFFE